LADVTIHDRTPVNTSDHVLVSAVANHVSITNINTTKQSKPIPTSRPIWDECDAEQFELYVENNLKIDNPPTTVAELESAVDHIIYVLSEAEKTIVPQKRSGIRKQKHFTDSELEAIRTGKKAFSVWKAAGKPSLPHPAAVRVSDARKHLRQVQRHAEVGKRIDQHVEIMEASEKDNKLFYKLIARQRKVRASDTLSLTVNGITHRGDVAILAGWRTHFAHLATPSVNEAYDASYKLSSDRVVDTIRAEGDMSTCIVPVTEVEIQHYISKLNTGKAPDESGMMAEHLKRAGSSVYKPLANLLTGIINIRHIPNSMHRGILTPVYKRGGKPVDEPGSYRGITVCSLLSKILEHFIVLHTETLLDPRQSELQCGFTRGTSPAHASLLVTEAIAEQKDSKEPLFMATLDAQRAFDVVDQASLMWKWHELGLKGRMLL
jgi:hypothetical protein